MTTKRTKPKRRTDKLVSVTMPSELYQQVKTAALADHRPVAVWVRIAAIAKLQTRVATEGAA